MKKCRLQAPVKEFFIITIHLLMKYSVPYVRFLYRSLTLHRVAVGAS